MPRNLIGVMQGRLLPKYKGRYQAHPVGYWQDEFAVGASLGIDLVEWILDFNDVEKNPIISESGVQEIQAVIRQTGVHVKTICADYFMEAPLHSVSMRIADESKKVLLGLIKTSIGLGIENIVIPCVDQSQIASNDDMNRFIEVMKKVTPVAKQADINLCLETDLAPKAFANLLYAIDSPVITVNYDTGNSASLGYNPAEEVTAYGSKITDIHIKDRKVGGGSVLLGTGNTRFESFFESLAPLNYRGPFILQAFRDDEGLEMFKTQLKWAVDLLKKWGYR